MEKLFRYANQYVEESDWKDMALLKLCLCAMGIIIGTHIAPKCKKSVTGVAAGVFVATYIPMMTKFVKIILRGEK